MSRRNGDGKKLDLKLNLSPPRVNRWLPPRHHSPSQSSTVVTTPTSPPSSCVSSELNSHHQQQEENCFSNSPEATSMIVAGCPRCLMYVMLPEKEPRCPKCKSTVLLEVFSDGGINGRSQRHSNASKTEEKN